MDIKQDKNGFYYDDPPEGTRVATEKDFENIALCVNKVKPFLCHGFHSKGWYCYRVRRGFTLLKIMPWLQEGKIYVWEVY